MYKGHIVPVKHSGDGGEKEGLAVGFNMRQQGSVANAVCAPLTLPRLSPSQGILRAYQ